MIIDTLSYEIPATLTRYGRSDAQHYRREYNRLKEAMSYLVSDFKIKVIHED